MAGISGFWSTTDTSPVGDQQENYSQSQLAEAFKVTSGSSGFEGVINDYLNGLMATVTGANAISISSGSAMVDGHWYCNYTPEAFSIPSAVGAGNTRIDRIVARCDWAAFKVELVKIAGVAGGSPVPPDIETDAGTLYDIPLWQALVTTAGVVTLTDERKWARPKDVRLLQIKLVDDSIILTVRTDALFWTLPEQLAGYKIVNADIGVTGASSSGAVTADVKLNGSTILTTPPSIPATELNSYEGTRGITNNPVVATGDVLSFDVTSAGTGAKGLEVILVFEE